MKYQSSQITPFLQVLLELLQQHRILGRSLQPNPVLHVRHHLLQHLLRVLYRLLDPKCADLYAGLAKVGRKVGFGRLAGLLGAVSQEPLVAALGLVVRGLPVPILLALLQQLHYFDFLLHVGLVQSLFVDLLALVLLGDLLLVLVPLRQVVVEGALQLLVLLALFVGPGIPLLLFHLVVQLSFVEGLVHFGAVPDLLHTLPRLLDLPVDLLLPPPVQLCIETVPASPHAGLKHQLGVLSGLRSLPQDALHVLLLLSPLADDLVLLFLALLLDGHPALLVLPQPQFDGDDGESELMVVFGGDVVVVRVPLGVEVGGFAQISVHDHIFYGKNSLFDIQYHPTYALPLLDSYPPFCQRCL